MMNRCEDFPCCGHTYDDPCAGSTYDPNNDPHLMCDHETGMCDMDDSEDEWPEPLVIHDPNGILNR